MIFSYLWLKEYAPAIPTPTKLRELLETRAFEVEYVKKYGTDWLFDIDILPNRAADAKSHAELAREIAAIASIKFQEYKTSELKAQQGSLPKLTVRIQDTELIPRYHAIVLENIKITESPLWMKKRLNAVGVNSINSIVDLTNYVMLETGQPLHAFDYDSIKGHAINIRAAQKNEQIETLEGTRLLLDKGMLIIEDKERIIDLLGIKGGKNSGITKKTKNVILQAVSLDSRTIYKTKKRLAYTTQAADLYAAGLDRNLAGQGLQRAWNILQTMKQATITQVIDKYPKKSIPVVIKLDLDYANSLLGTTISTQETISILERLGLRSARSKNNRQLIITVPTRRQDLKLPEDIIEEVGRLYGYHNITPAFIHSSLLPQERNWLVYWRERARDMLVSAGLTEVYLYSFIAQQDCSSFHYTVKEQRQLVKLENPISEQLKYPQASCLENLVKVAAFNSKHSPLVGLFEISHSYLANNKAPIEQEQIVALKPHSTFYDMKGVVEYLCESFGITDLTILPMPSAHSLAWGSNAFWHKTKTALIQINNTPIGLVGEVSSRVTRSLKLLETTSAMVLDMAQLASLASKEQEYRPVSRFPSSMRDISLLVPQNVSVARVLNVINEIGGELVIDVDLFDMYQGGAFSEEKKRLAFRIVYQSKNRTLKKQEIDLLQARIVTRLNKLGWELRE